MKKLTKAQARAEWVKALRSGKYRQTSNQLWDGERKYCCLGVACEVYNKFHDKKLNKVKDKCSFDGKDDVLPERVSNWLGITNCGHLKNKINLGDLELKTLIDLNDDAEWKFSKIADVIEERNLKLS